MELEACKPQELSKFMVHIRVQYDELARKNREEQVIVDDDHVLPNNSWSSLNIE